MLDALHNKRQSREEAAQARICRELSQEWLRVDRSVQQVLQVRGIHQQKCIALQVGKVIWPADRVKMPGVVFKRLGKGCRRCLGFLRYPRVNDSNDQIGVLREQLCQSIAALLPA